MLGRCIDQVHIHHKGIIATYLGVVDGGMQGLVRVGPSSIQITACQGAQVIIEGLGLRLG